MRLHEMFRRMGAAAGRWDIQGVIIIMLMIIVFTTLGLEIPKKIYDSRDKSLLHSVDETEYNISYMTEHMELSEKIEAISQDDTVFAEKYNTEYDESVIKSDIRLELCGLLDGDSGTDIVGCMFEAKDGCRTTDSIHILEIIQVRDAVVYSFDVAVYTYQSQYISIDEYNEYGDSMSANGSIIYDLETGKLLYVCANDTGGEWAGPYDYADTILVRSEDYYDADGNYVQEYTETMMVNNENEHTISFEDKIKDYYDMDINYEASYIMNDLLVICPFDYTNHLNELYFIMDRYSDAL